MNVLILGGGSREHSLAHVVAASPQCDQLYIAPGNAGTAQIGMNLGLSETDFQAIKKAVLNNQIGLVISGPEKPLIEGLNDFFQQDSELSEAMILGPDQEAAWLEGSKAFAKAFMQRNQVPTGSHKVFHANDYDGAVATLRRQSAPYVIKADGLAAGKGVAVCQTLEEAEATLHSYMVEQTLGEAGQQVVIEEYLKGREFSVFVLTDGQTCTYLPDAQDYKRAYNNDQGPNTGGMGAIAPAENLSPDYRTEVHERIVKPTLEGLKAEGYRYKGFLYFGLIDVNGAPYVLEYNVRLGDPEAAAVLALLDEDPLPAMASAAKRQLPNRELKHKKGVAASVVMASGGYPGKYEKGKVIQGLESVSSALVFHAGTAWKGEQVVTAGGRVLTITGLGTDKQQALEKAYQAVDKIHFEDVHYRTDIGQLTSPV